MKNIKFYYSNHLYFYLINIGLLIINIFGLIQIFSYFIRITNIDSLFIILPMLVIISILSFYISFTVSKNITHKEGTLSFLDDKLIISINKNVTTFIYDDIETNKSIIRAIFPIEDTKSIKVTGPYYTRYTIQSNDTTLKITSSIKESWQPWTLKDLLFKDACESNTSLDQVINKLQNLNNKNK
ncbi:MAG: hypothetical protein ACK5LC_16000 [Coprobacillaceae bacterium]